MSELSQQEMLQILREKADGLTGLARADANFKIAELESAMVDTRLGPDITAWPDASELVALVETAKTDIDNAEDRANLLNDIFDKAFGLLGVPMAD